MVIFSLQPDINGYAYDISLCVSSIPTYTDSWNRLRHEYPVSHKNTSCRETKRIGYLQSASYEIGYGSYILLGYNFISSGYNNTVVQRPTARQLPRNKAKQQLLLSYGFANGNKGLQL
jgi:hypothetical protein